MQSRDHVLALEFWAKQTPEERKKILEALQADEKMADHDFAGLPPEVRTGIAAGLTPAEEQTTESTSSTPRGRHRRSDDD